MDNTEIPFVFLAARPLSTKEGAVMRADIEDFYIKKMGTMPANCKVDDFENLIKVVEYIEKLGFGFKMCRKVVEIYVDSSKETIFKVKMSSRKDSLIKAIDMFLNEHLIG